MTARTGTEAFETETSRQAEKKHTKWVKEIVSEFGSDFRIAYSITISDIVGRENNLWAWKLNGKSATYKADGGFIFCKDDLIAVCEHNHQNTDKNACERAPKYLTFMHDHELFISTSGPGFSEEMMNEGSTATAKFLAVAMFGYKRKGLERGAGISHNENEEEFKKTFREWFEYRVSVMGKTLQWV